MAREAHEQHGEHHHVGEVLPEPDVEEASEKVGVVGQAHVVDLGLQGKRGGLAPVGKRHPERLSYEAIDEHRQQQYGRQDHEDGIELVPFQAKAHGRHLTRSVLAPWARPGEATPNRARMGRPGPANTFRIRGDLVAQRRGPARPDAAQLGVYLVMTPDWIATASAAFAAASALPVCRKISITVAKSFMNRSLATTPWASDPAMTLVRQSAAALCSACCRGSCQSRSWR